MMLLFYLFSVQVIVVRTQSLPGSCAFENGTCGYVSDPTYSRWTMNQDGHFITVGSGLVEESKKAVLVSPDLDLMDWSCLRLVYQITGSGSLQLHLRPEGENFDHTLWTTDTPSESWLLASIDLWNTSDSYKIILEGTEGDASSSVAVFEIRIVPGYCIECDFEEPHLCGYRNQQNSSVNWYLGEPATPISQSNLLADDSVNHKTGHYMYVDSVYANRPQEVARLVSPMTNTPISGCLSFYYLRNLVGGSSFSVFTRDRLGQGEEIWTPDAPDTSLWTLGQVDLKAPYPLEVVFEVVFNKPSGGQVMLDNISFSPEFCNTDTEPTFDPSIANCDFESGFCQYRQDWAAHSAWKRVAVKPNIYRTGDHTTGSGSFLLVNTRLVQQSGYVGRLFGPRLPGQQKYCLRFYYSLTGFSRTESTLAVYLHQDNSEALEKIWSMPASSRDVWTEVDVTFQKPQAVKVVFVSICENSGDCGSVALDDITIALGDCSLFAGSFLSIPSQCDFETGNCGYTQDKQPNTGGWVLARGPTPTSYTGPNGDHTTGVGHYMYIEASSMLPGQKARLISRDLRGCGSPQCLYFHFHMFGSGMGRLSIYLRQQGAEQEDLLWSRQGELSVSWLKAAVDYQCDHTHQIVFEAVRGTSVRSDIAIDDIVFKKGPCKDVGGIPSHFGFSEKLNEIEH